MDHDKPEHYRGGYPLSGDPAVHRQMHVGHVKPRCTSCGCSIYGDEEYLPNRCFFEADGNHRYPNGDAAPAPRGAA